MSIQSLLDKELNESGIQIIRVVVDITQECNLNCLYCHPGKKLTKQELPVETINEIFRAAEKYGILELVISGGEPTLHPDFSKILQSSHILKRTTLTLITNATLIDKKLVQEIAKSNITRICVSLDGADRQTNNYARGESFDAAYQGLLALRETEKEITVISVAHKQNYRSLIDLTYFLCKNKLAFQHHLCAPSYSGSARNQYDKLKLDIEDYYILNNEVEKLYSFFKTNGLFLTFNTFWLVTGQQPLVDNGRSITLSQIIDRVKNLYVIIRPNGDFWLTAASWGRETIGNATIGNVFHESATALFNSADKLYRECKVTQLSREIDAKHQYQIGKKTDTSFTDYLISDLKYPSNLETMVNLNSLTDISLLSSQINIEEMKAIAESIKIEPSRFRIVKHSTKIILLFDRNMSIVTLFNECEFKKFAHLLY